jgi:hypothetical protein
MEEIVIRHYRSTARFVVGIAAVLVIGLQICPAARSQDPPPTQQTPPPSLGDVARKYREEKAAQDKATPKNTFTNDGLGSGKGGLLGAGVPEIAATSGTGSVFNDAIAKMDGAIQKLDLLGSLDRATLINIAMEGATADFPGRKAWEDRMVAARQVYVVHGKELLQSSRAVLFQMKALHDAQPNLSPNDPRVQAAVAKLKADMQDAERLESGFKAVAMEGHDLAAQARH